MRLHLLSIFCFLMILSSCGSNKSATKTMDNDAETLKAIVANYNEASPDYKTMRGRLKGVYTDGEEQYGIGVSYRFKRDEVLWMSVKLGGIIQLAKMKITPNNIKFYERIDQSYFDGDFQLISSFVGIELNYEQLQNLFIGQAIEPISITNSTFDTKEGFFEIQSTYDDGIQQNVLLDDKTFKIKQQIITKDDKNLLISYKSYQDIESENFPEEIEVLAGDNASQVSISLTFKSINLNDDLKFPFSIPDNFKPIKLK